MMKIETRDLQKNRRKHLGLSTKYFSEAYEKSDLSQKSKVLCASLNNYEGACHITQKPEKSEKTSEKSTQKRWNEKALINS